MKLPHLTRALAALALAFALGPVHRSPAQTTPPPDIVGFSRPVAGQMQMVFHGKGGPYRIQNRTSMDASAPWFDVTSAKVTEIQTGVFLALLPINTQDDIGFFRVVNENETIAEVKGWTYLVQVSAPANKSHFVVGESPVITVTILDNFAQGITRSSFSSLNLYMHGPEDPKLTKTAVKLLNATTDRTKTPHHYIDLRSNADVQVNGNVLTYTLKPVTDEAAGTYTVTINAVRGDDMIQQLMKFASVQIGTATVEPTVTTKASCTACHEGTMSGKMYMHHADVGRNPYGSWAIDLQPEKSCKACHNNDGYAAFTDASAPGGRRSDHIVIRAHGVHMGEGLKSAFNTNSTTGNFRDYLGVVFPANVRNCTTCHVDDRWKTEPTRLACGSCHDNVWFGPRAEVPAGMVTHSGGSQTGDAMCTVCHAADSGGMASTVAGAHHVAPPPYKNTIELSLSAPANGKFYTAGDKPVVTVKVLDAVTGLAVDPANIREPQVSTNYQANEWRNADLFVSGPRALTVPVLTTAAALKDPLVSRANNDMRVRKDPAKEDKAVTRTSDAIQYQLGEVTNLATGTYTVYAEFRPGTGQGGYAMLNFQVGSTNAESFITPASACISCHADSRIHSTSRANVMNPELCKSCHDYSHQMTGKTAWTTSQWGFGVSPISRRVHGAHYGRYLEKGNENGGGGLSEIIFPQDIRNCTKCHADPKNSTWNEKPSRLACLACHDSTESTTHAALMTLDPTPADPWSGDETETCTICHGPQSGHSAKNVHSIANPYVPPYPREP